MADIFDRLILLKQSSVFSMVNTDDLRVVAQSLEEQDYFAGDRVFEIHDQGDHLYLLVTGKIGVSIDENPTSENYIVVLESGDTFGEMNLLDGLPRSATAHVIEDATVLTLEKNRLRGLIQSYPDISIGMLRSLSLRIREVNDRFLAVKDK